MTSAQRDGLKDAALALTEPMIDELIKDISRRIRKAGAITDTAEYQIYRAQALGASKKEVGRRVAEQLTVQEEVISSLFEYVLDKSLAYEDNGSLRQMADSYARMTKSKTAEMLKNLWGTAPDGKVLPLQDAYARALDYAFRETATGVLDMETAIRRAVGPLAKRGCARSSRSPAGALALNTPAAGTSWISWARWTMKCRKLTTICWGATAGRSARMQRARRTTSRSRGGSTAMPNMKP